jgi:hypothetical protein
VVTDLLGDIAHTFHLHLIGLAKKRVEWFQRSIDD